MVYLIIQINNGTPAQYPFNNETELNQFLEEKFKGITKCAITENVYFIHKKIKDDESI